MKTKLIEAVRQLLIKTILPLRRRRERFLSNFRFSITFRIALNYLKLFLLYGALFFVAFCVYYLYQDSRDLSAVARDYIDNTKVSGIFDPDYTQGYFDGLGVTLRVTEQGSGLLIYDNTGEEAQAHYQIGIYYNHKTSELILRQTEKLAGNGTEYCFEFYLIMNSSAKRLQQMFLPLFLLLLLMIVFVLRSAEKGNRHLLEPVDTMVRQANRLTASNLKKERLNIEGTKNELKDLATTINGMLDRIETSYESQQQFVSDASHELRTPIAVIQGYVNMLDRWGKKDEAVMEEAIDAIKNEAQAMQELVEKLLFLSRHDKKTLKLKKAFFNMREIVEDMLKETHLVAHNRNVESDAMEDVTVYGDKQALKQAVRVFIDNAVKYTEEGDTITISCRNDNGDCIVSVADSGIGMQEKDMDHIFERFYRSDQVRNAQISGHGLGLSLAKLIILKHTGRIRIRSQYTKGSTFTIIIPKFNRA